MSERLVILSDMWGIKKGMWITSYLGYLQQYYKIEFYDMMQLANMDLVYCTEETLSESFANGGIETAVAHLLKKEGIPSHYLAFCTGGTVAWKAALKGLPMKSLYAISPSGLHLENKTPSIPTTLLYGENHTNLPPKVWADRMGIDMEIVPNFGTTLYSDEKIIKKVSLDLLNLVTHRPVPMKKVI